MMMTFPNDANVYLPGVIAIPSSLTITNITKAVQMIVTVSVNSVSESNTYIIGQLVRLTVPITYGMFQADGMTGKIVDIGVNTLTLNINSTNFDTFSVPSSALGKPASLAPSGSQNLEYNNGTNQVGFQSLNNIGN